MQPAYTCVRPTHYRTVALRANCSLQVQRSLILPPCVSQFYARLRFSATRDTTSSTDNHCPAALQRCQCLLNGTPYRYLRVRHRPAMCVSLSMNASCCASVLPSTHDYAYRACDTSTTASRIAPARPKMLSIALVLFSSLFTFRSKYRFSSFIHPENSKLPNSCITCVQEHKNFI